MRKVLKFQNISIKYTRPHYGIIVEEHVNITMTYPSRDLDHSSVRILVLVHPTRQTFQFERKSEDPQRRETVNKI